MNVRIQSNEFWGEGTEDNDLASLSHRALARLQASRATCLADERETRLAMLEPDDLVERVEIWRTYDHGVVALNAEFGAERTRRLLREAGHALVDVPPYTAQDTWTNDVLWGWVLTAEGEAALRQKRQAARRATFVDWRGWLASLTGLLGVVVAILALAEKAIAK